MRTGMKISIGGKQLILPPLGLGGLRKTVSLRKDYPVMSEEDQLVATVDIIHAALLRNYPDLDIEEMKDDLDAWEITELMKALPLLFEKSGLEKGDSLPGESN